MWILFWVGDRLHIYNSYFVAESSLLEWKIELEWFHVDEKLLLDKVVEDNR